MARVHQRAASVRAARARTRATAHRKRPYKVILESITQEKKKLYTVISFEAEAPPGYTFIPAGNPHLTNRCKELSREHGVKVLIVSTTPHRNHKSTLSHQVHRIGHHFPSWIVGQACMDLGLHISRLGHVIRTYRGGPENRVSKSQRKRKDSASSDVSQATLNAEARDAIKDLFPKIPEADLNKIISRAFQKGKSRVGTASELSLPRRVQLAVVAHIRHVYTNYDRLLRTGTYHAARAQIEQKCLDQLVQWRGDGEDGTNDMEEILREVIVISDDEDDDADSMTNGSLVRRDSSVEIISSHALANDVQVRPVDYRYEPAAIEYEQPSALDYMAPGILRNADRTYQGDEQRAKERFGRRGFSRYKAWDQALDRYRKAPIPSFESVRDVQMGPSSNTTQPQPAYGSRLPEDIAQSSLRGMVNGHYARVRGKTASMEALGFLDTLGEIRNIVLGTETQQESRSLLRPLSHHRRQSPPQYLETDLQGPITAREAGYSLAFRPQPQSMQDYAYLDSTARPAKIMSTTSGPKLDQRAIPSSVQQQDRVLPSIESPAHHVDSSIVRRVENGITTRFVEQDIHQHAARQNMPILIRSGHTPVTPRVNELEEYADNHLPKRRRVTDLTHRPTNEVPVVTSKMAQIDVSDSRPGRVEWIESGLVSRRPIQTDMIRSYGQEPGSHNQRIGMHDRVQTTMGPTYHHEPFLRSVKAIDTDHHYQDPYQVISTRTHGDFVREPGYQTASSGQPADRVQTIPESRAARVPVHRADQYDMYLSADRLPHLHEANRTSQSTQRIRARLRDDDHMDVYPIYIADSQTNTSQALPYVGLSEGHQSRSIYLNESVQLTSGDSVRREAATRPAVMGAEDYMRYERIPEHGHVAGKPYPLYRRPMADSRQRPPASPPEPRKVGNARPPPSSSNTYGDPTRMQALPRSHRNSAVENILGEDLSDSPSYIPFGAEPRRYIRADRPNYVRHGRDIDLAGQHTWQGASPLGRAPDRDGRSYVAHPTPRPPREVIVLD